MRYQLLAVDFMPEEVLSMHLGNAAAGLSRGSLTPLTRVCHSLKGVVAALRQMSQAQHVGKVVVSRHFESPKAVRTRGAVAISGGTGMIGQVMAKWLLETEVRKEQLSRLASLFLTFHSFSKGFLSNASLALTSGCPRHSPRPLGAQRLPRPASVVL